MEVRIKFASLFSPHFLKFHVTTPLSIIFFFFLNLSQIDLFISSHNLNYSRRRLEMATIKIISSVLKSLKTDLGRLFGFLSQSGWGKGQIIYINFTTSQHLKFMIKWNNLMRFLLSVRTKNDSLAKEHFFLSLNTKFFLFFLKKKRTNLSLTKHRLQLTWKCLI